MGDKGSRGSNCNSIILFFSFFFILLLMSCRAPWPVASSWRHAEPVRAWQGCARRWLLPGSIPRCAGRAWLRFSLLLLPGRGIISASHVNSALNPAAWGCSWPPTALLYIRGGKIIPQLWLRHYGEPKLLVWMSFSRLWSLCAPPLHLCPCCLEEQLTWVLQITGLGRCWLVACSGAS